VGNLSDQTLYLWRKYIMMVERSIYIVDNFVVVYRLMCESFLIPYLFMLFVLRIIFGY